MKRDDRVLIRMMLRGIGLYLLGIASVCAILWTAVYGPRCSEPGIVSIYIGDTMFMGGCPKDTGGRK